jgi:hypothetical protein
MIQYTIIYGIVAVFKSGRSKGRLPGSFDAFITPLVVVLVGDVWRVSCYFSRLVVVRENHEMEHHHSHDSCCHCCRRQSSCCGPADVLLRDMKGRGGPNCRRRKRWR